MRDTSENNLSLSRLWRVLAVSTRGGRRHYAFAACCVLAATAFAYLTPLVLRFVIDTVIDGRPFSLPFDWVRLDADVESVRWLRDNLWACGVIMLLCAAGQGLFDYLRALFAAMASEGFARRLRNQLLNHVNQLPFQTLKSQDTGDLIQRCTSDVETVRQFVETQLIEVTRILAMIVLALPVMAMLDLRMTGVSTVLLPLVIGGSIYYFGRVRTIYGDVARAEAHLSTVVQENLTGMRLVKAFGREDHEADKFQAVNETYRDDMLRMMRTVSFYWGFSAFLCMAQICLVLSVGAMRAAAGLLTVGTLTVFLTYVAMLVWPIRMLGHVLSDAGRAHVSLGRIAEVLGRQTEPVEVDARRPPIVGAVEFRAVNFAYGKGCPALKDVSFSTPAGKTVAILGRTGSGKSTLVHLLPRLLEYSGGSILIDGCELNTIDRRWIRRHIGIVLQEPFLFSRSIRENILLGDAACGAAASGAAAEHRMLEAAGIADIHHTIQETFQQGYDTRIGEKGVTLSGGQRQRVAIARALLGAPPILVLDDSLSAVDAETDRRIQAALKQRHGKATTFIISHRISTLCQADQVLVFEKGELVQCGSPEELARVDGLYRKISDIQNELEEDLKGALSAS